MKGNRGKLTKGLNVEAVIVETEMIEDNRITSKIHSKLKKKQKKWVSNSDKVVHHVSKTTRKKRLI